MTIDNAVKNALSRYRAADTDEAARMTPISELLRYAAEGSRLRVTCQEIAKTHRFADYAYLHNNGFFVIYLADPNCGLQVRLHVWAPSLPPTREHPHRHRMGFVSHVLCGVLRSTLFERVASPTAFSEDVELYREMRIEGPTLTDFDAKYAQLHPGPLTGLRPVRQIVHRAGEMYRFPSAGIHRVDTAADLRDPVVTLTVWEPPFQSSIAYEPIGSSAHARSMTVRRLDTMRYDEVLSLALASVAPRG